jgi:hypothetical protein
MRNYKFVLLSLAFTCFFSGTLSADVWKIFATEETDALSYTDIVSQSVGTWGTFRSFRSVSNIYCIFEAVSASKTIQSIKILKGQEAGSYAGDPPYFEFQILDLATDTVQHTVTDPAFSAAPNLLEWYSFTLSSNEEDLEIGPNEYLVAHFVLPSGPSDTLDIRCQFEVVVSDGPTVLIRGN